MRRSQLFIQSDQPLDQLKDELSAILSLDFAWDASDECWWAVGARGQVELLLYVHDFESETDLPFEEYRYVLRVADARDDHTKLTRQFFRKLSSANRWRLLMTNDLQVRLDEFEPTAESGSAA